MPGDAQEQVQFLTVPIDWQLSVDSQDELALMCIPHGHNTQVEVLSIGITGRIVGTGALTARAEWRDALVTGTSLGGVAGAFIVTNVVPTRVLDCDDTSLAEVADVLGTLIADLARGLPLPDYTITNLTRDLSQDSNAGTIAVVADQVGQLVNDVKDQRIVDVVFSNTATDREYDADSTSLEEVADVLQNLHDDLTPTVYLHAAANLVNQGIEGYFSLWNGALILDQGDALNLEITNTAGTDKEGYAALVEYRVLRRS
jgi:hypothetical protein